VGSHLVDAFANRATKVIFITNREFAEPLSEWLKKFCGPLNIQFSLVSGSLLLEWLNVPKSGLAGLSARGNRRTVARKSFNPKTRAIHGYLTYTLDPNEAVGATALCTARSDRPVFAIIDINVGEEVTPFHGAMDMAPSEAAAAVVYRVG
jgi:hypothetical protein